MPCRLAQHLGGVNKDVFLQMQHCRRRKETWLRLLAPGTLSIQQDRLHTLARRVCGEIPSVKQCQKCQKRPKHPFGTFGTPWVSVFDELHTLLCSTPGKLTDRLNAPVQGTGANGLKLALALLWERRDDCPGARPVLVCHDEIVVECDAEQAAKAKAWLEKAMIEGMDAVLNCAEEVRVSVEVDARIAKSWGEGG
jgi:hypothetical protein